MSQKLIQTFLNEMSSGELKDSFDRVNMLLEYLENKNDPDPTELQLVEALYQFKEKSKILEAALRNHVLKDSHKLTGNKLDSLYNREPTNVGTQKLFD